MKRFFILASAAIVALASCAKTQVVYNDAPEEISFKKITGVMTKDGDEPVTSRISGTMGVFADHILDGATTTTYFKNIPFTGTNTSSWVGNPKQYYPLSGTLDFVAYMPYDDDDENPVAKYDNENNTLALTWAGTEDLLYSEKLTGVSKPQAAADQKIVFSHALTKIAIKVTFDEEIEVTNFSLTDVYKSGTYTVNYDSFSVKDGRWNIDGVASESWSKSPTSDEVYETYIVPSEMTSIVLTYNAADTEGLTHTITLPTEKWLEGTQYNYNITVTPIEITFAPEVVIWDQVTPTI